MATPRSPQLRQSLSFLLEDGRGIGATEGGRALLDLCRQYALPGTPEESLWRPAGLLRLVRPNAKLVRREEIEAELDRWDNVLNEAIALSRGQHPETTGALTRASRRSAGAFMQLLQSSAPLDNLQAEVAAARALLDHLPAKRRGRHAKITDRRRHYAVFILGQVFWQLTGQQPGYTRSTDDSSYDGPFVRFVEQAASIMALQWAPNELVKEAVSVFKAGNLAGR